jgi:hypothetical protein
MPLIAFQPARKAEAERDRPNPGAGEEHEEPATLPILYLPLPVRHFTIKDPEQWLDLCA